MTTFIMLQILLLLVLLLGKNIRSKRKELSYQSPLEINTMQTRPSFR
jgi:hypothetical protein